VLYSTSKLEIRAKQFLPGNCSSSGMALGWLLKYFLNKGHKIYRMGNGGINKPGPSRSPA
jgi:hypothetical protein